MYFLDIPTKYMGELVEFIPRELLDLREMAADILLNCNRATNFSSNHLKPSLRQLVCNGGSANSKTLLAINELQGSLAGMIRGSKGVKMDHILMIFISTMVKRVNEMHCNLWQNKIFRHKIILQTL
jgi:hypothetical protein